MQQKEYNFGNVWPLQGDTPNPSETPIMLPSVRLIPASVTPHPILNIDLDDLSREDLLALDIAIQNRLIDLEGDELTSRNEIILVVADPSYWANLIGIDN